MMKDGEGRSYTDKDDVLDCHCGRSLQEVDELWQFEKN